MIKNYYDTQEEGEAFYKTSQHFKTTIYSLSTLLSYYKTLQDQDLIKRIEKLEKILQDKQK